MGEVEFISGMDKMWFSEGKYIYRISKITAWVWWWNFRKTLSGNGVGRYKKTGTSQEAPVSAFGSGD